MQISSDWSNDWASVLRLAAAYALALPVGWWNETEAGSIGVRTFPLVAMASCGYVMLGSTGFHNSMEAQSRIIQGLVAGIGFIGGGAIMRAGRNVHGTAAAASIWTTGVLGAAVAQDRWLLAIVLSGLNLFALKVLKPLKERLDARRAHRRGPQEPR